MHPATYLYSLCDFLGQAQQPGVGQGGSPGGKRLRSALWSGSHLFPGGWALAPWWQALLGMCTPGGFLLGGEHPWAGLHWLSRPRFGGQTLAGGQDGCRSAEKPGSSARGTKWLCFCFPRFDEVSERRKKTQTNGRNKKALH